jgi:hypothetical protein
MLGGGRSLLISRMMKIVYMKTDTIHPNPWNITPPINIEIAWLSG